MEYILDMNIWRSGEEGPTKLGQGTTKMLNDKGYMCCLGQFAKQCGVGNTHLLNSDQPEDVAYRLKRAKKKPRYDELFVEQSWVECTKLAGELICINDSDSPVEVKVQSIKKALEKVGHSLKVIPLIPKFSREELDEIIEHCEEYIESRLSYFFLCRSTERLGINDGKEKVKHLRDYGYEAGYLKKPSEYAFTFNTKLVPASEPVDIYNEVKLQLLKDYRQHVYGEKT